MYKRIFRKFQISLWTLDFFWQLKKTNFSSISYFLNNLIKNAHIYVIYVCVVSFYIILYFTKSLSNKFHRAFVFSRAVFFFTLLCRSDTGMGLQFQGRLHFCQSGLVLNNSLRTHWHGVTWMNEMRTTVREKRKLRIIKSLRAKKQYLHLRHCNSDDKNINKNFKKLIFHYSIITSLKF